MLQSGHHDTPQSGISCWQHWSLLGRAAAHSLLVASRVHGIPDVVADERTGLLVPPRDVEALASAVRRLAGDADLRAAMGRAGRAFVEERYRWQENVAQMERLYQYLLEPFTQDSAHATLPES